MQKIVPWFICIIMIALIVFIGYYGSAFVLSDRDFQTSLVAAANNNGLATYQLEANAIKTFPNRDLYYRVFSQTNLLLANSIVTSQPKDKPLSDQQQKIIYALIQQSINSARIATTLSPATVSNWQNLSTIYRSLIGFGQNADQFALLTGRQAISLDSSNPQEYIYLGGLYYQLKQYDNAIQQFQYAVNIKPDFANAYYNLGHAYQEKGDLNNALYQYQIVRNLVANNPTNRDKIDGEISSLKSQLSSQSNHQTIEPTPSTNSSLSPVPSQSPLNLNKPATVLPTRNPRVSIPAPSVTPSH